LALAQRYHFTPEQKQEQRAVAQLRKVQKGDGFPMMRNNTQRSVRLAGLIVVMTLIMLGVFMPSIASAAPLSAVPASHGQGTYYTVRPGDTLSGIARAYGTTVNAIMSANNLYSSRIYVGQVLIIPNGGGGGGGGGWCSQTYVVRPGDTLSGIARWFGVSTQSLAQANGLYNPSFIYVGQRLCIPGGYNPGPFPPGPFPPGPVPPGPVPPGPTCGQFYTVRPGDSLSTIARCCGTTVQNLVYLNGIRNPSIIFVGQVLRIY